MKLILFSLLIPLVSGAALLGNNECSWGPSYWCSGIQPAKQCKAVDHCMGTVWKYQILTPKPSEACSVCTGIVNEAKRLLKDKATDDEIASLFAKVCAFVPAGDVKTMCKEIVTEDLPILLRMLSDDITGQMVCAILRVCSGLEDTVSHGNQILDTTETATAPANTTCKDCKKFIKDVQDSVTSNETATQLIEVVEQTLCTELASLENLCDEAVEMIIPTALNLLASQIDPDVTCRVFGFCAEDASSPVPFHLPMKNVFAGRSEFTFRGSEECSICTDVFTEIDKVLRDKTVQDTVKEEVEKYLCGALSSLEDQCKQLVEEYSLLVFDLLANELDPKTVCTYLGLCNSTVSRDTQLTIVLPARVEAVVKDLNINVADLKCTLCVDAFVFAEYLVTNVSAESIMSTLYAICSFIDDPSMKQKCNTSVSQYGPLVIQLLKSKESPDDICKLASMCTAEKTVPMTLKTVPMTLMTKAVQMDKAPVGGMVECEACQLAIKELLSALGKNPTKAEIEAELEKLCAKIPYKKECDSIVQTYGPMIIDLILKDADALTICKAITLCTATSGVQNILRAVMSPNNLLPIIGNVEIKKTAVQMDKAPVGGMVECEACQLAIKELLSALGKDPTKAEIEAELEKLCAKIPYKKQCDTIVQTYGPMIIDLILKDADALTICKAITLCTATSGVQNILRAVMSPNDLLPIIGNVEIKKPAPVKRVDSGEYCTICELVMTELDTILKGNKSEEAVNAALQKVCDLLPASLAGECKGFVNIFTPFILKEITEDPKVFCTQFGLCPSTSFSSMAALVHMQKSEVKAAVECDLCKYLVSEVDTLLEANKTEEEIIAELKKVCKLLPLNISSECSGFVDEYGPMVIKLLAEELTPDAVCQTIGMCTAQDKTHVKTSQLATKGVKEPVFACLLCDVILKELDTLLEEKSTQKMVRSALDKVCTVLPTSMKEDCTALVNTYYEPLINYLVMNIDPDKICEYLTICSSPSVTKSIHRLSQQIVLGNANRKIVGDDVECSTCEEVVTIVKEFISENKTKEELEQYLNSLCAVLPDTISQQCKDLAGSYLPAILAYLKQELNPLEVCQHLKLCPATVKADHTLHFNHPQKLGVKKCTYGPAYWCASEENAKECNALDHCMKHVWNV